jgi:ATP-binding cassette subfamily B protein
MGGAFQRGQSAPAATSDRMLAMMRGGMGGHGPETTLVARPGSTPQTLRRIAGFFRPYRARLLLITFLIGMTVVLGVINPILLKLIIDNLLAPEPSMALLWQYGALMIALPIISSAIGLWQTYLSNVVGQRVMDDLRLALYSHLQWMPLRFFTETRTGEIQSRIGNDVNGVQAVVTDTASSLLANVATVLTTVIAMFILDWRLTLLSIGMVPIFAYITYRVGGVRRKVSALTQQSLAEVSAITEETLSVSGVLLSKTFGQQRTSIARFAAESARLGGLQIRRQMIGRGLFAVVGTFFAIAPALVYLLAGTLMINGDTSISVGTIVAFTTLQSRLFFPIGQLLGVQVEIASALALFDRIFEYLEMPITIADAPDAVTLEPATARGSVRFRGVSFRYPVAAAVGDAPPPSAEPFGVSDLDFEARPGELVALVGPSGAGKTTTTYLIPRLYEVDAGSVEIDGIDIRKVTLESLGQLIGFVTQETYLFHASVIDNLRYARPEANIEQVQAAARAAAIHDRIVELPSGYDTVVGERGYKLSGGERQRLAIARVVLKDPRILLLDEATSSLDTVSERLIQRALAELMEGRTTIAIAHRLSTVLRADRILVYEGGRIVEQGRHADLLAADGLYARLYREQFATEHELTTVG